MGEIPHPMKERYYIERVGLYLQGKPVEKAELDPSRKKAEANF